MWNVGSGIGGVKREACIYHFSTSIIMFQKNYHNVVSVNLSANFDSNEF